MSHGATGVRNIWRIYRRFRLPSDAAVTGAFNMGGQLDDQAAGAGTAPFGTRLEPCLACLCMRDACARGVLAAAGPSQEQQEAYARELEYMQQQYAHLPEAVRAQMGIAGGGAGGAGPSSGPYQ